MYRRVRFYFLHFYYIVYFLFFISIKWYIELSIWLLWCTNVPVWGINEGILILNKIGKFTKTGVLFKNIKLHTNH